MGANLTIYCLENVTDYLEFERLCHDLMALEGYSSIEPLGGFSDKGRDAIHVDRSLKTTIFAYSVREDWRAKLSEDASKISKHGHACDQLIFVTNAAFSSGERDEAVGSISEAHGWELQLYGLERLRVLLDVTHQEVKDAHPQIFPPDFLKLPTYVSTSTARDHLFISYSRDDVAFAEWLTRKLTSEGYVVWCERFKLLGGETYPDDSDAAIKNRTFRVLALYSRASLKDPEVMRQRALALSIAADGMTDFLIPISLDRIEMRQLDKVTSSLKFIPFDANWTSGLQQLLDKLTSVACPKLLPDGKAVAASAFLDRDVLTGHTEKLFSNCLRVETIPGVIHRFKADRAVPNNRFELLQHEWTHKVIDPRRFLSFGQPPPAFKNEYSVELAGGEWWRDVERIEGIASGDLVVELLRKSLIVKCHERGLLFCPQTYLHYFPISLVPRERLNIIRPDGSKTFVNATGQRKYWKPSGSEEYRYNLAPVFSVSRNLFGDFVALVRIKIRLTNTSGEVLPKNKGVSRRKHLCRGWWNNDWLNRILAVSQFLADDNKVYLGSLHTEQIVLDAMPISMMASEGVNEEALDQLSFERSEFLAALHDDDLNEDADQEESGDE